MVSYVFTPIKMMMGHATLDIVLEALSSIFYNSFCHFQLDEYRSGIPSQVTSTYGTYRLEPNYTTKCCIKNLSPVFLCKFV